MQLVDYIILLLLVEFPELDEEFDEELDEELDEEEEDAQAALVSGQIVLLHG